MDLSLSTGFLIWFCTYFQSHMYVQDADVSIRKRALELVYLLVNDTNVKPLTKELVDYLEVSDQEFKEDLTAKIS